MQAGFHDLADLGYREVVLTGVDLGQYGLDHAPPVSLAALVRRLAAQDWPFRVRLSSLEPMMVTTALLDELAAWVIFAPTSIYRSRAAPRRFSDHVGLPTDFAVLMRSLTLFCDEHARRVDRSAAIARRIGDQLAQIEGHTLRLADRGLISRAAAAALFRSALRGVWQAAKLPPSPILCDFGRRDPAAFKPFPVAAPAGGRLRFAVASSGRPDRQEAAALELLAAALAAVGHEVSLALPASREASVEFCDGYWRHLAPTSRRTVANDALPPQIVGEFARVLPRRLFQFVVATRCDQGRVAYSLYRVEGGVANLALVETLGSETSDAARQIEARAACALRMMSRGGV